MFSWSRRIASASNGAADTISSLSRSGASRKAKSRHGVGRDDAVDGEIGERSFGSGMNAAGSTGARGPDQCATRADKVTNDDAGGLRNVTYEQVARNNPCAPTFLRKSLTDRTSDYAFQRFPQQVGPFSRLPNPGEMTQTGSPRAKALIASMSSGAAVSAAAKRFKVTLPRLLRRRTCEENRGQGGLTFPTNPHELKSTATRVYGGSQRRVGGWSGQLLRRRQYIQADGGN